MRILWHPYELKEVLGLSADPQSAVTGVTMDSREIQKNDLFIAFKGPLKDGYDFVETALNQGASHALVERFHPHPAALLVSDSFKSLEILAKKARERAQGKILGITGSFGKTTAKECAAFILRGIGPTTATVRSFNNHWGVPLSLANLYADDAFGVFEMGMNHLGELASLTQYVKPHVALITTIAGAHQGNFHSLEEIAQAKSEIFLGMHAGDHAVLPIDNPYYSILLEHARAQRLYIISFGQHPDAMVRLQNLNAVCDGLEVTFTASGKSYTYHLNAFGEHLVQTTLGVMAALHALGTDLTDACEKMKQFHLISGRGQILHLPWGNGQLTIVDESYNAGPESMTYGLKAFDQLPNISGSKWVILGDMLELGENSKKAHQELAVPLIASGIKGAFLFGPAMKALHEALPETYKQGHYETLEDLSQAVISQVKPGDALFIKGSRGQRAYEGRMAQVIHHLKEHHLKTTLLSA